MLKCQLNAKIADGNDANALNILKSRGKKTPNSSYGGKELSLTFLKKLYIKIVVNDAIDNMATRLTNFNFSMDLTTNKGIINKATTTVRNLRSNQKILFPS
jgi:nitrogen regulatory protein PII